MSIICIGNFTFSGYSVPSLHNVIYDAARKVPNPDPAEVAAGRLTVFDTWLHVRPDPLNSSIPKYYYIFFVIIL